MPANVADRPGQANRPGDRPGRPDWAANRPGANRPGDNRPGDNRPGINRPGENRPGANLPIANRPGDNRPGPIRPDAKTDRPVVVNRPVIDNDRTKININNTKNITNTNVNNTTVINQNIRNVNRTVVNQQANRIDYSDRFYGGGYPGRAFAVTQARPYYQDLHHHWQPANWSAGYRPSYYNANYNTSYASTSGGWLGAALSTLAFNNPFNVQSVNAQPAVQPTTQVAVRYDYSQPIQVPDPTHQETEDELVRSERAIRRFDDAREVFRRGEYGRASELIDEAIQLLPSDPTLHQFRALILFARQRYQEAAAALYSILAVSPGWDYDTLTRLYDDPQSYEEQVRNLNQYVAARPEATDGHFLLGYHSLVRGDAAQAEQQFAAVDRAQPGDRVTTSLLTALRGEDSAPP